MFQQFAANQHLFSIPILVFNERGAVKYNKFVYFLGDHTRVKLSSENDYINANSIQVCIELLGFMFCILYLYNCNLLEFSKTYKFMLSFVLNSLIYPICLPHVQISIHFPSMKPNYFVDYHFSIYYECINGRSINKNFMCQLFT